MPRHTAKNLGLPVPGARANAEFGHRATHFGQTRCPEQTCLGQDARIPPVRLHGR